jgi:hypothetical protein
MIPGGGAVVAMKKRKQSDPTSNETTWRGRYWGWRNEVKSCICLFKEKKEYRQHSIKIIEPGVRKLNAQKNLFEDDLVSLS